MYRLSILTLCNSSALWPSSHYSHRCNFPVAGYSAVTPALVIIGLLTCTLWYTVTSVNLPPWAITALEAEIRNFFCEFGKDLTYAPVEGKVIYFNANGLETFTTVTEPTLLVGSLFFLLQDFIKCFSILLNPIYHQSTIIFLAVTSTALYILSSINKVATPHQDNRYFN